MDATDARTFARHLGTHATPSLMAAGFGPFEPRDTDLGAELIARGPFELRVGVHAFADRLWVTPTVRLGAGRLLHLDHVLSSPRSIPASSPADAFAAIVALLGDDPATARLLAARPLVAPPVRRRAA